LAVGCAGLAVDGLAVDGLAVDGRAGAGGFCVCVWATAGRAAERKRQGQRTVKNRWEQRADGFM
jgi:hypothetical protein